MIVKHCFRSPSTRVLSTAPSLLRRLSTLGLLTILSGSSGIVFAPEAQSAAIVNAPLSIMSTSDELSGIPPENVFAQAPSYPLLQFGSEGPEVQTVQALLKLLGYYSGVVDGRYQENTVAAVSAFQNAAGLSTDGILGPTTWEKLLPSVAQTQAVQGTSEAVDNATGTVSTSSSSSESPTSNPANEVDEEPPTASNAETSANSEENAEPAPTAASSSATNTSTEEREISLPTLRLGMRGPAVQNLQERLSSLGLLQGSIDGVFGSQTEDSVKAAQRYYDLTPDGIVGPATWRALLQ